MVQVGDAPGLPGEEGVNAPGAPGQESTGATAAMFAENNRVPLRFFTVRVGTTTVLSVVTVASKVWEHNMRDGRGNQGKKTDCSKEPQWW